MFDSMNDFVDWLNSRLKERNWSYSELARRAGVSPSNVSMVMSEQLKPSFEFCSKISRGLNLPPSLAMQKAGLLGRPNHSPTFDELVTMLEDFSIEEQADILDYAHYRQSRRARRQEQQHDAAPGSEPLTS